MTALDPLVATQPERAGAALRAAHLYYLQDLTMEAIAAELHTSRSSVSRLLAFARSSGLVSIEIRSPADRLARLERVLHDRYGVTAHPVPMPEQTTDVERLDRVALSAGRQLSGFVGSNTTLGVAWGSTMSAVSRHLVPKDLQNVEVVQLNGAGNTRTTGIVYASEILRGFGAAFGAHVQQFPVPTFFDDPATKVALWRERSMRRLLEIQGRMDVTVFGVGAPFAEVPSRVYIGGYLEAEDYASLQRDRVVGDVATVFYREDGSDAGIALNARGSGPDLQTLRAVPRRICVVAGLAKLRSLQGALAAGLVTDLILDEALARALVEAG